MNKHRPMPMPAMPTMIGMPGAPGVPPTAVSTFTMLSFVDIIQWILIKSNTEYKKFYGNKLFFINSGRAKIERVLTSGSLTTCVDGELIYQCILTARGSCQWVASQVSS